MKLCKDCKYHSYRMCQAPQNGIDIVDGKSNSELARVMRANSKLCGYDAVYFVQRKPVWKFWS